jgi:hypothetical protein
MFGKPPGFQREGLDARREQVALLARELLAAVPVEFDACTPLHRAVIGTFFFGMLTAHGMQERLPPEQIHALAVEAYQTSFNYTPDAAAQAARECIEATDPSSHDTMNAILHRGIDGHAQHVARDIEGLRQNIASVLEHF